MNTLCRAINAALRMGRADLRPESDRDVLADIGAVVEEIGKQLTQAQRDAHGAHIDQVLRELPERDLEILRAWKSGMRMRQIAERLGLHYAVVASSLSRTYAALRMKT